MFNKLRNRLAIFNGVVLVLFVVCFASVIWLLADRGVIYFSDKGLKSLAAEVDDINRLPAVPRHYDGEKRGPGGPEEVKIVLRDTSLQATVVSPRGESIEAASREIAKQIWEDNTESWDSIETDGQHIRIYSTPFHKNGQNGVVQTSFSLNTTYYFLTSFMTRLFVVGFIFAIIAAFIGWILAGRAIIPVKTSWQKQEEFVADASHELRTPLTVIQTNLDVALSDPGGTVEDNIKWLENAYTETQQMGRLINDLLLLAKIDSNEAVIASSSFNFSELVDEISIHMETVSKNYQLHFNWDLSPDLVMQGDAGRIRQLFMILLDNAFKYTPANGTVILSARKCKDKIEIMVQDSGIGISEKDKDRIFDRFYRVDKARSHSEGGTGLGLSIAKWIVDAHHGSISVRSEPGRGTSFIVFLPGE